MYIIQHCFIFLSSDSTVSEDTGIEPRTVATLALTARRCKPSARSHPKISASLKFKDLRGSMFDYPPPPPITMLL